MGKGIRYEVEDKQFKVHLAGILDANYTDDTNFEIAKEASKKGVSYELLYIDEKARLRTKKLEAESVIPIYSQRIGEFLECAIRIWTRQSFIESDATEYAELYTKEEILTFSRQKNADNYELIDIRNHNLGDIPIIVYWNNEECVGDYEDVITIIDAYDKAQSDTANDSEYFADAYLYITGALGGIDTGNGDSDDDEDEKKAYRTMRRERILNLDEHGQAGWLVKNVNDTAQENYKNRLYKDIFFISQVPPLSDESFAGNLSGIAILYKLVGLDELTTEKQNKFNSAQKKKLRIITDYINTLHNQSFDADDIEVKFERNFIDNLSDTVEIVNKLSGIVSDETLLGLLPFIKDVKAELDKIKSEENDGNDLMGVLKNLNKQEEKQNEKIQNVHVQES